MTSVPIIWFLKGNSSIFFKGGPCLHLQDLDVEMKSIGIGPVK